MLDGFCQVLHNRHREGKKRRQVNVDALYLQEKYWKGTYRHKVVVATIVLLREGDRKADIKIPGEKHTEQVGLSELYPLNQRPKLDAFVAAKERERAAEEAARESSDALEPFTAQAVREIVAQKADEAA